MAIYHFSAKSVSRRAGQSAVAKAAYNARDKLINDRTGERHDYRRQDGLLFSGVYLPAHAPEWAHDRARLWSEAEKAEKRKDATLAREYQVALPHELTDEQRRYLVQDFVKENFTRKGYAADVCLHAPDRDGDERNFHAHILVTDRRLEAEGFAASKAERQGTKKERAAELEHLRERWEHHTNRHLERHGHAARVDRRSLEAQGIDREPTQHLGPTATTIEREGKETERGKENRAIAERNRDRAELKPPNAELRDVRREIAGELARQEATRQHEPEEPRRVAREGEDAAPRLAVIGNSMGRTLGHVLQTLGDVLDYFMGTRPTQGHAAPKIEAEPEPGPTIQEQRRQTLRTSAETIGQDPNAQSLAQSMNLDEDIRQRAAEIARQQRENWLEEERERDR